MSTAAPWAEPATPAELAEAVRAAPRVVITGAGTKPRLSEVSTKWVRISTRRLTGMVEYEPSEFTFTARAGTPVAAVAAELAAKGQYLPFDPVLAAAGATLGGTVAAGLNGPGRFRYGGLRDFILGVTLVDGEGRLLRLGGRVVKNAAGFDVPKFLVGSAGRFAALAEVTFKVFPRPPAVRTLRLAADGLPAQIALLKALARGRWEADALDAPLGAPGVLIRLAAPDDALDALSSEILARWSGVVLPAGEADVLWARANALGWAHPEGTWLKVPVTPAALPDLAERLRNVPDARGWFSAGGNLAYVSLPAGALCPDLGRLALTLRGNAPLWPGAGPRPDVLRAIKAALDPVNRFPGLDD